MARVRRRTETADDKDGRVRLGTEFRWLGLGKRRGTGMVSIFSLCCKEGKIGSECRRDEASVRLLFHDVDQISGTTLPRHYCIRVRMKQNENRLHNTWFRTTDGHGQIRIWTKPVEKKKFPRAEQQQKPTTTILCFRSFLFFSSQETDQNFGSGKDRGAEAVKERLGIFLAKRSTPREREPANNDR